MKVPVSFLQLCMYIFLSRHRNNHVLFCIDSPGDNVFSMKCTLKTELCFMWLMPSVAVCLVHLMYKEWKSLV